MNKEVKKELKPRLENLKNKRRNSMLQLSQLLAKKIRVVGKKKMMEAFSRCQISLVEHLETGKKRLLRDQTIWREESQIWINWLTKLKTGFRSSLKTNLTTILIQTHLRAVKVITET